MTIKNILHNSYFKDKHILFLIIEKILGLPKEQVYLNFNMQIPKDKYNKIKDLYNKYIEQNIPIEYLINEVIFMNHKFYVDENVLIPRPETEYLVKYVLEDERVKNYKNIYDIGTGSGIIAINLAKYLQNKKIIASDISSKALEVAKKNANNILTNNNIVFLLANLGEHINKDNFILCANLPYIKNNFYLDKFTKKEPDIALFAGEDGLDLYRKLIKQLNGKKYVAFFELTKKQADTLNKEFNLNGKVLDTCHFNIKILNFETT